MPGTYSRIRFIIIILIGILIFIQCSDPVSEEDEKNVIATLIEGSVYQGSYIIFWDGKDKNDNFVPAGTYYARLYSRDFTFQLEMVVMEGSSGQSNNHESIYLEDPGATLNVLEKIDPDNFYVQDGTNIHFTLNQNNSIRLTIRNKE